MTNEVDGLRVDRDEMPACELKPLELSERAERTKIAEIWKTEVGTPHEPCKRQAALLQQWTLSHKIIGCGPNDVPTIEELKIDAADDAEGWRIYSQLEKHKLHCPQCVVFPMPVPYRRYLSNPAA